MLFHAILVANPFDPAGNGFDIGDALDICLIVAGLYGFVRATASGVRWMDAKRDKAHRLDVLSIMRPVIDKQTEELMGALEEATKPIQPTSNGGLSMTDLHMKVDEVVEQGKAAVRTGERALAVAEKVSDRLSNVEQSQRDAVVEREQILTIADKNAHAIVEAVHALGGSVNYQSVAEYLSGRDDGATLTPEDHTKEAP